MYHRAEQSSYCTPQQAAEYCVAQRASFVIRKGAVDWYRMPDASWLAVKWHSAVQCEVRALPKEACGCS